MIAVYVILGLMLIFFVAGTIFYRMALRRKTGKPKPPKGLDKLALNMGSPLEWTKAHQTGEAYITSRDGLKLHARLAECPGSDKFVIACHGYGSSSASAAMFGRLYYERGYSLLMPDARGHGASEGNAICMGWKERLDIVDWARYIEKEYHPAEMLLTGISMGGATVMNASGEDLPECVHGVIDDCGFVSIRDEFRFQIRRFYHLPPMLLLVPGAVITRIMAGYSPISDGDTCAQLRKSSIPILIIHGEADSFVPVEHGRRAYEAANPNKRIVIVPKADHAMCLSDDPKGYEAAVDRFIAEIHGEK